MRRASLVLAVSACALALSNAGVAQPRRRPLHTRIDGDLLAELTGGSVAPPASAAELARAAASANGWHPDAPSGAHNGNGNDPPETLHPREEGYQAPTREMDRRTAPGEGERLRYREVFTPSVSPFKRQQAYDMVDSSGQLTVRMSTALPVPVGDDELPAWAGAPRSRFVGEISVEVSPNAPTPVPSVGAEERVVSYTTSTGHPVVFTRDSAGNLFVMGTERETLALTYVLEVPEEAFQPREVPHVPIAQAASELPEGERPVVPDWLRADAPAVLAQLNIPRDGYLDEVLGALVRHFRAFRDEALPDAPRGDLYSELATQGVGACRHRAYAMMLTLHALGIPARYVGNEAHAWVEVYVTRVGWTRFDLGGWNVPLDREADADRPHHQTQNPDPFLSERPSEYSSSPSASLDPTRGRGQPDGGYDPARAAQPTGAQGQPGDPNTTGSATNGAGAGGHGGGIGSGPGAAPGGRSGAAGATAGAGTTTNAAMSPRGVRNDDAAERGDPGDPSVADELAPVALSIATIRPDETAGYSSGAGFVRGSMVLVEGELRDERTGGGVGGLAIELVLVRARGAALPVGTTVSRDDGHWEARVVLPAEIDPGEYNLRANTPGDTRHAGARAE